MEKIERLAKLNPEIGVVSIHALEMFRLLRGFAMLDWTLRHPNDMGMERQADKFGKLVDKTWEIMDRVQGEAEGTNGKQLHD